MPITEEVLECMGQRTISAFVIYYSKFEQGVNAFINPLSPNISVRFLRTVLHMFLMVLVGRICIQIKSSFSDDHFLYSHDLYV